MYIRVSQSGPRRYLRLVESVREGKSVKQKHIANLGNVNDFNREKVEAMVTSLRKVTGHSIPEPGEPEFLAAKSIGGTWVLNSLWRELGLSRALKAAFRSNRRSVDVEAMLRVMIFNRLCDPDSKLGALRWLEEAAIPGIDAEAVSHQQLLRAMDALESQLDAVRDVMARLILPLIDTELTVAFYDMTTVRISGHSEQEDDLRRYGLSKEGGIARQYMLGVVQSAEGIPLDFEVFSGNQAEVSTLVPMMERVLARYPVQRVCVVADRGLLSLDNCSALEALGKKMGKPVEFVLALPAARYGDIESALEPIRFDQQQPCVREGEFNDYRLLIAHDPEQAKAASEKRREKINELTAQAEARCAKLDRQDQGKTERGRRASDRGSYIAMNKKIQEKHLGRFIECDLNSDRFSYSIKEKALQKAEQLDGKLLLISNCDPSQSAESLVARYKSLADIEQGFKTLKSDIEIAPVHHRLPKRLRAHSAICFIALFLQRVMRLRLKANASNHSSQSALRVLNRIQHHEIVIDNLTKKGIGKITKEQEQLLLDLGVAQPEASKM